MYKEMSTAEMLREIGTDPQKWAEAFVELNPYVPISKDVRVTEMIGWFSRAQEASWNKANKLSASSDQRILGHLKDYRTLMTLNGNHPVANNIDQCIAHLEML